MGLIKRQGFKRTLVSYASVLVGIVSTLFVYPLELSIYGTTQFYLSLAILLTPLASFGIQSLGIRFYPDFKDPEHQDNGFLSLLTLGSFLSFLAFSGIAFFAGPYLLDWLDLLGFQKEVITDHVWILSGLVLCTLLLNLFGLYASNAGRVVVPELIRNLGFKLGLPVLILMFHFQYLNDKGFHLGLLLFFVLMTLGLAVYLKQLNKWSLKINWSILTPKRKKEMGAYALIGILTVFGGALAFRIDSIMITSLIDAKSNGVYNVALFITNTIIIPFQAITAIASPIIADKWVSDDRPAILDIYRRSSLNLLLIGSFLLTLIYLLLDDLILLSSNPEELNGIGQVVLLLGLAKLLDMTTGLNNQIIAFSTYYRFNLYIILLLGTLNLGLNYWLIPSYGVEGAAWATLISLSLYNLGKFLFIWVQFRMQPFTWACLSVVLLCISIYGLCLLIPDLGYPLVNLIILGSVFSAIFWFLAWYTQLSADINEFIDSSWKSLDAWIKN